MLKYISAFPYFYKNPSIKTASAEPEWVSYLKNLHVNGFSPIPPSILEYQPENFLYFQALAVFGGEKFGPNENGDYFSWQSLKDSYMTLIGKGVYIEHKEDKPTKAVGMIFDAQFIEDGYIVVAGFLDKKYASKYENYLISPDFKVSMSVAVGSYSCLFCGKKYIKLADRCIHTAKHLGEFYQGKFVAEENHGLHFVGISLVEIPGESKAQATLMESPVILEGASERTPEAIEQQYEDTLTVIKNLKDGFKPKKTDFSEFSYSYASNHKSDLNTKPNQYYLEVKIVRHDVKPDGTEKKSIVKVIPKEKDAPRTSLHYADKIKEYLIEYTTANTYYSALVKINPNGDFFPNPKLDSQFLQKSMKATSNESKYKEVFFTFKYPSGNIESMVKKEPNKLLNIENAKNFAQSILDKGYVNEVTIDLEGKKAEDSEHIVLYDKKTAALNDKKQSKFKQLVLETFPNPHLDNDDKITDIYDLVKSYASSIAKMDGWPTGLDIENFECIHVGKESIGCVAGGDWQDMTNVEIAMDNDQTKLIVVPFLSFDKDTQETKKKMNQYYLGE